MSFKPIAVTLFLAAAALGGAATLAQAQSCQSLWVERNTYYKQGGYCFKTPRAIRYFGNAGCAFDRESDVPLSAAVRARIAQITRLERVYGCN